MFHLSSTTAAPYGSRGLFLIREMANFCYRFFFCSLKKKKQEKQQQQTNLHMPKRQSLADAQTLFSSVTGPQRCAKVQIVASSFSQQN